MSSTESEHLDAAQPAAVASQIPAAAHPLDLDLIEADLADVDIALARLDTGEYWRDEVTGAPLDDALLARRPTARRPTARRAEQHVDDAGSITIA